MKGCQIISEYWMTGQETNLRRRQVQGGGGGARVLREGRGEHGEGPGGDLHHGAQHRVQERHSQVQDLIENLIKHTLRQVCIGLHFVQ